jgi:hypothetical protein
LRQFSINSESPNPAFNHIYDDLNLSVDIPTTNDFIDNANIKNDFCENNLFNEVKQVYLDEQKDLLKFDNNENLNRDLSIVKLLEIKVSYFYLKY